MVERAVLLHEDDDVLGVEVGGARRGVDGGGALNGGEEGRGVKNELSAGADGGHAGSITGPGLLH